jgi:N-acetylglucosamine repressor
MEKATRTHTKEHNRILVLKTISDHEHISRAEIARLTRLTGTTVSDIVSDLIEEGLVREVGVGQSQGGKNPILLGLVEDSRWLIGLDLAQNEFRGAVVNLRGKLRDAVAVQVVESHRMDALPLVYQILDKLFSGTSRPLSGIGVGTPGLVNTREGLVVNAVNLNWRSLPLSRLLEERYRLPVCILNDCHAAAIGENTYGKDPRMDENLILINVHHGIGAGIIINGEIFHGDGGFAGEIGHVVVVPEGGEICRCGKRGCLETVASVEALIRQAKELTREHADCGLPHNIEHIDLDCIEAAFKAGNPLMCDLVLKTAEHIGVAISHAVGLLNIQRIVLKGDMTRFGDVWLNRIRAVLKDYSLARPLENTRVEIARLGENAVILGAAAVLANNYSFLFAAHAERQRSR